MSPDNIAQTAYCSTIEAARMLGVGVRTVQLWVDNGILQAWKTVGGHRRIALSSVQEVLAQRAQHKPAAPMDDSFKLLVVEDSNHYQMLYRTFLDRWGLPIRLITAVDGFEGLIKIGEEKPDAMVADLVMPGMDGFDMICKLRNTPAYAGLDIVVITGMGEDEIQTRRPMLGDTPIMHKPVDFPRFKLLLEDLLRKHGIKLRRRQIVPNA